MVDAILITMLVAIQPTGDTAVPVLTHTRPLSARAQRLVAAARQLSPTIESMLEEIERSDVIAYIDLNAADNAGEGGATQLAGANRVARFVRVTIDFGLEPDRRIETLGHELQHVLEVARATDVRDDAGMLRLFRRIGWMCRPSQYETDAAVEVQHVVRRELWTTRARPESHGKDANSPRRQPLEVEPVLPATGV